jgi:uncharacterized protein (TIGR04255 family)
MGASITPGYKQPPVIETVMGVEFVPLEKWSIPHFGLYWTTVRKAFPDTESKPVLVSTSEGTQAVRVEVQSTPEARCWFIDPTGSELIQVQKDRFLFNWRKTPSEVPYPRYHERVRPQFINWWKTFSSFLENENIEQPEVLQCDLTYINHIPKGDGWEVASDWHNVFSVCGDFRQELFLPAPESRRFAFNYQMPNEMGSLNVSATRAVRTKDGKEIILFQLTAKGKPASSNISDITEWLDTAHDWVVKGFTELTMPDMHKRWGRET